MSSIIRKRNADIRVSLRSRIDRAERTSPDEEIPSLAQPRDAAPPLGEAVSPTGICGIGALESEFADLKRDHLDPREMLPVAPQGREIHEREIIAIALVSSNALIVV
jgi:hypothetical protein